MASNARIAMAVGLGYLLGRRKKMRTAMAVGAAIAAGRFSRDPASLLQRGGELLGNSSVLGQVGGLTKPLQAAGKAAARGMVSRGIDSMGDRIKRRTDALRTGGDEAELDSSDESTEQDDEATQDEAARDERPQRSARPRRAPARSGRGATAEADDEDDEDADDFAEEDEDDEEDEAEAQPRPRARQAPGLRRRPNRDDADDGGNGSRARTSETSDGGGAPVRRRVSKR